MLIYPLSYFGYFPKAFYCRRMLAKDPGSYIQVLALSTSVFLKERVLSVHINALSINKTVTHLILKLVLVILILILQKYLNYKISDKLTHCGL